MIAYSDGGQGKNMKEFFKKIGKGINQLLVTDADDHTGAYAAMSAFFFVLSLIPIILLLLTLVQYTPLTKVDVMSAVANVVPDSITPAILAIVNQVYNQSAAVIPITILVALWSAGRGVLAMTSGLNCIYKSHETRNYIFLRIRATFYTVSFLVVIVVTLVVLGFGNSISLFVEEHIPIASHVTKFMIEIRTVVVSFGLMIFSLCIYKFLPNRNVRLLSQLPGAVFTSVGWLFTSFFVSKYMEIFKGFEDMYGSLTTIVLIMLWLYFSMYIMLLGGKVNMYFQEKSEEKIS